MARLARALRVDRWFAFCFFIVLDRAKMIRSCGPLLCLHLSADSGLSGGTAAQWLVRPDLNTRFSRPIDISEIRDDEALRLGQPRRLRADFVGGASFGRRHLRGARW
jgi:hypothetical protein